jgi:hypothetical protein
MVESQEGVSALPCTPLSWRPRARYPTFGVRESITGRWRREVTDTERLDWLANTVLCCDYGDNQHPGRLIGWRVMEFHAPVAYGKSFREAIDSAMAQESERKIRRSQNSGDEKP